MYLILTYIVIEYVSMFINAVYTCQMIGPCIFTDLYFRCRLLLSCDYMLIYVMTTRLVIDPK